MFFVRCLLQEKIVQHHYQEKIQETTNLQFQNCRNTEALEKKISFVLELKNIMFVFY